MTVMINPSLTELLTPADELHVHPANPRLGDLPAIVESMRTNGVYRPVYAQRSTGYVLAGNHTYQAMRSLGFESVPVVWLDVDDEAALRILLADNRTADLGSYDNAQLADLLEGLSVSDLAFAGTGYAASDLDELLTQLGLAEPGQTDPDDIPEPPAEPFSKRGDLWLLGDHRLLCGDSTNVDDVTRLMGGEYARLLCTDPPYLVEYDGLNHPPTVSNRGSAGKPAVDYIEHEVSSTLYSDFLRVARQVALVDRLPVYQWYAASRAEAVFAAWRENGLLSHQEIIWHKPRPVLKRMDFMVAYEPCMYGWVQGSRPDIDRRPPSNTINVWEIDQQGRDGEHPTEKPVEIFARPLRWHLLAGELAYEPFSGSGSQIIAAQRERRRCYAIELSPPYVDVACRRWQEYTGLMPINAETSEPHDFTKAAA